MTDNIEGTRSLLKIGYTELEMTFLTEPAEERRKNGDQEEKEEENRKDSDHKLRQEPIRRLIIAVSILIAGLLANSCFSVIAPFYPKEVVGFLQ